MKVNLDTYDGDEYGEFSIPAGVYTFIVTDFEIKDGKKRPGVVGEIIKYEIVEGKYKGYRHSDWITVQDPNTENVAKGTARFVTICKMAGLTTGSQETKDLLHRQLDIKIVKEKNGDFDNMRSKRYYRARTAVGSPATMTRPMSPTPQQPANQEPPAEDDDIPF